MSMAADFGYDEWEVVERDWDFEMEEESSEEARLRMSEDERAADLAFDPFAAAG